MELQKRVVGVLQACFGDRFKARELAMLIDAKCPILLERNDERKMLTRILKKLSGPRLPEDGGHEAADRGIGADVPIRRSDQDRLRRVDFANRIATVLSALSLAEGRVFAIRGGWGFGKSSLKHLVIERLEARADGADWLDFNPWQWGDSDAIARALFGQIADKLGGAYSAEATRRAELLRRYGSILTGVAEPVGKIGAKTAFLSSVMTSVSVVAVASAVGFSLPAVAKVAAALALLSLSLPLFGKGLSYLGRDRSADPLDRMRLALEKSLRALDRPLVIFVDDIDRLEPEQIRLLVRQVKANANLPNLVFVLIFQPSIVEAALDPISGGNGQAFLEKVIQASFDLPAVPLSTVQRIFTEQLSSIAGAHATEENGFQQVRWGNVLLGCIYPYLRNLRDARRLLSSIAVHLPLHAKDGVLEVNIVDFLALETMRVFESTLHERLFREHDLLLQSYRYRSDGLDDVERPKIQALLAAAGEGRREVAKDVIKELFPQAAWAFGNMHYGSDWHSRWLTEKRVCSPRFFPRYFELQTPEGEISESEFISLLDASSDADRFDEAVEDLEGRNLLPALAQRFDESVDRLPVQHASIILPALFTVGQKLVALRSVGPFNSPWVCAWRAASWFLRRIPVETRSQSVLEALSKTGALSMGAILIHLNDPANRKGDSESFDPTLNEATVVAMKEEWLRQVAALAQDVDRMLAQPDLLSLLYRWRDYSGSLEAPRAWVDSAIVTDAGFAAFTTRMMSQGTSQGWDDRVASPYDTFDQKTVDDFVGLDSARARIEALDPDAFTLDAHALRTLREHLDDWRDVRKEE